MSHIRGFFKKITKETASYDALAKQPIVDAENKLYLFRDATSLSISALDSYQKSMIKTIDLHLGEKFLECKELFRKFESRGDLLTPNFSHVLGSILGKINEMHFSMHHEVVELVSNIEKNVIKPLKDYQEKIGVVRENRKELKDAYDKIDQYRSSLEKAKRDVDNAQRTNNQTSRMGSTEYSKRMNDLYRLEDKVTRIEKELDDANASANEKYDKYTEGLFKRVAEECDLSNFYLDYLKAQRRYHKQALKRIDSLIPDVKDSLKNYNKKPVFGCSLSDYVNMTNSQTSVSPVIRKLIEGMCRQDVFNEEGIFRVAGSRIKMNCILYAINAGYLEYLDTNNDYDVHCLAGVLKQYIRELPDSILCNDLQDEWINSINTPMPNKLEAFKNTLQKLPKANYENLRYLIKFLAKIVENSEKTKMTTTNMGICFGVSLLSSSKSLNSSNSISNLSSQTSGQESSKSIDMTTATNVFDFLLTNHFELFPGEINFLTGANLNNRQSFVQHSVKISNIQGGEQPNYEPRTNHHSNNVSYNSEQNSSHSNRYSVMINDSFNSMHEPQINSPYTKPAHNSMASPSPSSSSSNITNINRHIKNNSMDIKFMDHDPSHKMFPSLASQQANSNSTISLDSGSSSPKLRSKKQAPAPPKTDAQPISQVSPIETVNEEQMESPLSTSVVSTSSANNPNLSTSKCLINNSETSISSSASTSSNIITKLSITNENGNENQLAPTFPARSSSFKISENHSIEKPSQPPPQVPARVHLYQQTELKPPPIGFLVDVPDSSNQSIVQGNLKGDSVKNKENINAQVQTSVLSADAGNNLFAKPPKPTLPRRMGNSIASYLSKFEKKAEEETSDEKQGDRSSSEITSL
ncbi:rho GTPase-activating 44-like isoform X3 [Brachionus plicatilis]|uniref:Rho GTPase-activating 44-like isoform X3 n=1 Tax=Brachionus plicatilis TaxID=10195 RepID=A0A3M7SVN5_BRAPC|nr:rho GTPase-activating 44-like isoform X3 [Brachionus plicatilis]